MHVDEYTVLCRVADISKRLEIQTRCNRGTTRITSDNPPRFLYVFSERPTHRLGIYHHPRIQTNLENLRRVKLLGVKNTHI